MFPWLLWKTSPQFSARADTDSLMQYNDLPCQGLPTAQVKADVINCIKDKGKLRQTAK